MTMHTPHALTPAQQGCLVGIAWFTRSTNPQCGLWPPTAQTWAFIVAVSVSLLPVYVPIVWMLHCWCQAGRRGRCMPALLRCCRACGREGAEQCLWRNQTTCFGRARCIALNLSCWFLVVLFGYLLVLHEVHEH